MNLIFKIGILVIVVFAAVTVSSAQGKKVRVHRFEVDGKVVPTDFKAEIVGGRAVYQVKTDDSGYYVPAEVTPVTPEGEVRVILRFRKHVLAFFVHTSNFNVDWLVVGVDAPPFDPENIGDDDPSKYDGIHYIVFAGEPERRLTMKRLKGHVICDD